MELTVLGSGSLVPTARRGTPGFLVRVGGRTILVDSGSGTLYRLLKAGVTQNDLDMLCYTHVHLDHVGDFPTILFTCKYAPEPRTRDLPVFGGRGFIRFYEKLNQVFGEMIQPDRFNVLVEELDARDFDGFSIKTGAVDHIPESVAFRFDSADGKALVISGDTDYSETLIELARGAEVLVTECSFPEDHKMEGHLTPSYAGRLAQAAGVKRLVLAHIYPPADEVDIAAQCRRAFDGEVIVAEDQMRIEV